MELKTLLKSCLLCIATLGTITSVQAQNLALTATSAHSGGGATGTPDYSAANYNDNTIASCGSTPWGWVSTNGWIEYTWSTPQLIASVKFFKDNRPMTSCTIEYWNGSTYVTSMTYSNSITCEDSVVLPTPITTTKLRFNNVGGSSNPNHREIRVWGVPCSTQVTQDPPPAIIVCEEGNMKIGVKAQDVTDYQWQLDNGSGYVAITNSTDITGATTDTLRISNIPTTFDNAKIRCLISKTVCRDSSTDAEVKVNGLVKMQALDNKDTTCISATKDLEIKVAGAIQTYRWQIFVPGTGFVDVPFAPPYNHMGNILRIEGVPDTLDGSQFRVIVDGVCNSDTSNQLQLSVAPIPGVGIPPADTFVKPGNFAFFKVEATAAGARYQWQAAPPTGNFVNLNDGGIYTGVKTNILVVKAVSTPQNNFRFRCIVMSSMMCNSPGDTSDEAVLTVDATSVNDIDGNGQFMLYPNPANASDLYISATTGLNNRRLTYNVVDNTGRLVLNGNLNSNHQHVDIGRLGSGIYMVQITEQGRVVGRSKFTKL